MAHLSFVKQLPEPLEFEWHDGTMHRVKRLAELSAADQQEFLRLHRQLSVAVTKQRQNPQDTHAAESMLQCLNGFMQLIGVDIRDAMSPQEQMQTLEWWIAEHPELSTKKSNPSPLNQKPTATKKQKKSRRD